MNKNQHPETTAGQLKPFYCPEPKLLYISLPQPPHRHCPPCSKPPSDKPESHIKDIDWLPVAPKNNADIVLRGKIEKSYRRAAAETAIWAGTTVHAVHALVD